MLQKRSDEIGTQLLIAMLPVLRHESRRRNQLGVTARSLIRKTTSVIALVIAGDIASSAVDYAADANTATVANTSARAQNSDDALHGDALRRDDIRWAQLELRTRGLTGDHLMEFLVPRPGALLASFRRSMA
jgi:hypothetical protein